MTFFWDVAPYSFVETDRRFISACCLHREGEELLHSAKSKNTSHLHTRHCLTPIYTIALDNGSVATQKERIENWRCIKCSVLQPETQDHVPSVKRKFRMMSSLPIMTYMNA
jgi:hypothetical protein